MREVPQRLASPSEETPKKKKKADVVAAGGVQVPVMGGRE